MVEKHFNKFSVSYEMCLWLQKIYIDSGVDSKLLTQPIFSLVSGTKTFFGNG